ncbi:MAG: single-stranded-DNA-specific exonuclease RecJ [SAR324 cluster bacterium]|nr:single-stranded-DNA-specific exonuclease RecJ [SAR324 cluster bacterium]
MGDSTTHPRRSLCNQEWTTPEANYQESSLDSLCDNLDISEGLGRILAARDLLNVEDARRFLNPAEDQLHPPREMLGMEAALERIHHSLVNYEKVLVFGDYDVDGTAATAILYNYLKRLGSRIHYYIPHRIKDGYSIGPGVVTKFKAWEVELLITADHGSTAVEGAELLHKEGIDLIVTDHHQLQRERPRCAALVNPHQEGCPYPFKELSAAGVVFKLICALDEYLGERKYWDREGLCYTSPNYYLDLVALATVADMTPLLGENRTLVKLGLDLLNSRPRPGLSGLIKECNIRGKVAPSTISFKLAPRINALGRIGDPGLAVKLMLSHSFTEARKLARHLTAVNKERRAIEQEVFAQALRQVEQLQSAPAYVIVGEDWHPGVMGSIASRIAYQTHRPTIALTRHPDSRLVGSARSWHHYNILEALQSCAGRLIRFGGHPSAAGLSLSEENLEAFTREFYLAVESGGASAPASAGNDLEIDTWVTPDMLNERFFDEVAWLSPFGHRNPEPVLALPGMTIDQPAVFNNRHLKFNVRFPNGRELEAKAWDHLDWHLDQSQRYDLAFVPHIYHSPDGPKSQLKVVDMMHHG